MTDGAGDAGGESADASSPSGEGEVTDQSGTAERTHIDYGVDSGPAVPDTTDPDFEEPGWYLNRELSALSFQKRVLAEATDPRTPLFERLRFLSLFTRNTDEFCMKRVGGLKQQMAGDVTELSPDGRTPAEQWELALETLAGMFDRQDACYRRVVGELLPEAGAEIVEYESLSTERQRALRDHFRAQILPTLTPLTVDPTRTFPFISNLSLSLAVQTRADGEAPKFSRVKVPENQPRLLDVADVVGGAGQASERTRFVLLEEVIGHNLDLLFPNVEVVSWSTFRVTRNAEVRRNEEVAEGLIEMIEGLLRDRRFATVVRLEVSSEMSQSVREFLATQLDLDEREVFERTAPLNLRALDRVRELDRPDLSLPSWTPQPHPRFAALDEDADESVFDVIREDDVLVHHPYHSFDGTVQRLLSAAAADDDALAIKVAIYRTTHDSKVIESLIEAARNGTEVAVMVELKARFDEENNLRWVRRLEEEGIHVAYGTVDLKAHSKTALVVRREADGVRLYSHVGTGNYHAETARAYVDLGLMTCDPAIGQDLVQLFNSFTGHSDQRDYGTLLVAPSTLRPALVERIRAEAEIASAGGEGRIVAKMNALEDRALTAELYHAAAAGVDIDLIVRDVCRLRPGVEGVTDTVTVRSVVGRFLEHSRIFYFGNDGDPRYYIGSADWMERNLDRRVEAVAPIEDTDLRARLDEILDLYLADNRRAWEMAADGSYVQCRPADAADVLRDVQQTLMDRAAARGPDEAD
ncbi:polyphosphate kinase 1 [Haloarcula laminariae]|uniref:polyphosphate kinase 1 n=1 Tax=Haloarcula laminariae TaxID=2961577 RepID=UPI0024051D7B|nr:polyphosphate kinase 1 [Halomicroarcula sp. FL173]